MSTDAKLDLYKLHKSDYAAKRVPAIVDVADARYLAIEGRGEPGGPGFQAGIGALYGVAFTVKMTRKMAGKGDYAVCKLEAQWWHDGGDDLLRFPKSEWCWRMMIRTPDFVEPSEPAGAARKLIEKNKGEAASRVRLKTIAEGRCVQMLHVGPYEKERETIEAMRAFAEERGFAFHGLHHEIYLSDPRRVEPSRLKTILRRPVR